MRGRKRHRKKRERWRRTKALIDELRAYETPPEDSFNAFYGYVFGEPLPWHLAAQAEHFATLAAERLGRDE